LYSMHDVNLVWSRFWLRNKIVSKSNSFPSRTVIALDLLCSPISAATPILLGGQPG
jgi:hypothetical protein